MSIDPFHLGRHIYTQLKYKQQICFIQNHLVSRWENFNQGLEPETYFHLVFLL